MRGHWVVVLLASCSFELRPGTSIGGDGGGSDDGGNVDASDDAMAMPDAPPMLACVRELTGGGEQSAEGHTCALRPSGQVLCWGANPFGQLGDGTTGNRPSPFMVPTITDAIQVEAASHHTCVVRAAGTALCWGRNLNSQLGDGTIIDRPAPVAPMGLTSVAQITAGHHHTCARTTNGSVWCWGENVYGSVGDGTNINRATPVQVSITDVVEIESGEDHVCARRGGGDVWCWGFNADGQLGDTSTTSRNAPVQVAGLVAKGLAGGFRHTCALTSAGGVSCWGRNDSGQLGNGTFTPARTPVAVSLSSSNVLAVEVEAGDDHTCARLADGALRCWGNNQFGQLGNGTTGTNLSTPVVVALSGTATMLGAGGVHTCARTSNGTVQCWGRNASGQLGTGTTTDSTVPIASEVTCP